MKHKLAIAIFLLLLFPENTFAAFTYQADLKVHIELGSQFDFGSATDFNVVFTPISTTTDGTYDKNAIIITTWSLAQFTFSTPSQGPFLSKGFTEKNWTFNHQYIGGGAGKLTFRTFPINLSEPPANWPIILKDDNVVYSFQLTPLEPPLLEITDLNFVTLETENAVRFGAQPTEFAAEIKSDKPATAKIKLTVKDPGGKILSEFTNTEDLLTGKNRINFLSSPYIEKFNISSFPADSYRLTAEVYNDDYKIVIDGPSPNPPYDFDCAEGLANAYICGPTGGAPKNMFKAAEDFVFSLPDKYKDSEEFFFTVTSVDPKPPKSSDLPVDEAPLPFALIAAALVVLTVLVKNKNRY